MKALLEKEVAAEREFKSDGRPLNETDGLQTRKSICSTCIHEGRCVYQGRSTDPILFCEEFESERPESGNTEAPESRDQENSAGFFKGLCANCDHRNTCMFADSISGIWHCEEYK